MLIIGRPRSSVYATEHSTEVLFNPTETRIIRVALSYLADDPITEDDARAKILLEQMEKEDF